VCSECGDTSIGVRACRTSKTMGRCDVPYSALYLYIGNGTLVLHNTRIQVIRSVTQVLVITSMRNNTPVGASGHRQDMGEHDEGSTILLGCRMQNNVG